VKGLHRGKILRIRPISRLYSIKIAVSRCPDVQIEASTTENLIIRGL
jgi:hypothetical protein